MRRLFAPIFWLTVAIILAKLTVRFAPYLAGMETLEEQVNGTLPAGMLYLAALDSLNTIFNLAICFCVGWLISKIIFNKKEKHHE